MADQQQYEQAPPPRGQGAPPPPVQEQQQAWPPQPMVIPRNDFGQLVRQGFGLGIGIWLAFAAIGALLFVPLLILAVIGAAA